MCYFGTVCEHKCRMFTEDISYRGIFSGVQIFVKSLSCRLEVICGSNFRDNSIVR